MQERYCSLTCFQFQNNCFEVKKNYCCKKKRDFFVWIIRREHFRSEYFFSKHIAELGVVDGAQIWITNRSHWKKRTACGWQRLPFSVTSNYVYLAKLTTKVKCNHVCHVRYSAHRALVSSQSGHPSSARLHLSPAVAWQAADLTAHTRLTGDNPFSVQTTRLAGEYDWWRGTDRQQSAGVKLVSLFTTSVQQYCVWP